MRAYVVTCEHLCFDGRDTAVLAVFSDSDIARAFVARNIGYDAVNISSEDGGYVNVEYGCNDRHPSYLITREGFNESEFHIRYEITEHEIVEE